MHISPVHRATHFDILKQPASHCQLNPVQTFVRHSRRIKPNVCPQQRRCSRLQIESREFCCSSLPSQGIAHRFVQDRIETKDRG